MRSTKDSALLFGLLFLTGIHNFFLLWLAAIVVSYSGRQRLAALAFVNVFYIVATGGDMTNALNLWPGNGHLTFVGIESYILSCAIRFLCIVALGIIVFGLFEYHRRTNYTHIVIFNILVLAVLVAIFKVIPLWGPIGEATRGLILLFAKYFWAIAFSLITLRSVASSDRWKTFASISFWTPVTEFHIGAVPRGVGELIACEKTEQMAIERSRLSGIFLVAIGVLLNAAFNQQWQIAYWLGYPGGRLPQMLSDYASTSAPLPLLWLRVVLTGLSVFFRNAASVSIAVGLVRFAGFNIPLAQYGVFRSRNFADLFRRIYFYYSETITYFFYFPLWKSLRWWGFESKLQGALAQFLAIVFGGVFLHALIDIPILLKLGVGKFAVSGFGRLPYLTLIGVLSAASSSFARKKAKVAMSPKGHPSRRWLFRSLGLLVVYFFCVGLAGQVYIDLVAPLLSAEDEWGMRMVFFKKIFNL